MPNKIYNVDKNLDENVAFKKIPPAEEQPFNLPSSWMLKLTKPFLPKVWVKKLETSAIITELAKRFNEVKPTHSQKFFKEHLKKHLQDSHYFSSDLNENIKKIYSHLLISQFRGFPKKKTIFKRITNSITSIFSRKGLREEFEKDYNCLLSIKLVEDLTDDIEMCSEGFNTRVNVIVKSLKNPSSLEHLIYMVREKLVNNAVINLNLNGNVHDFNAVSWVAKIDGLGIIPNFENDKYISQDSESVDKFRIELINCFGEYTGSNLAFLAVRLLQKEFLPKIGYIGRKEDGYAVADVKRMLDYIKKILGDKSERNIEEEDYFIVKKDEDLDIIEVFLDINLAKILQDIYLQLIKKSYIISSPTVNSLLDHARFKTLSPTEFAVDKSNYIDEFIAYGTSQRFLLLGERPKIYLKKLEQLQTLASTFPEYFKKLVQDKRIQLFLADSPKIYFINLIINFHNLLDDETLKFFYNTAMNALKDSSFEEDEKYKLDIDNIINSTRPDFFVKKKCCLQKKSLEPAGITKFFSSCNSISAIDDCDKVPLLSRARSCPVLELLCATRSNA